MTKTDAWILAAIGGERPISLDDLVSSADYLNRLIPTKTEVEEAVNHLQMAGLAQVQDRRFRLTSDDQAWLSRFGWQSRGAIVVWIDLADAWNGLELSLKARVSDYQLEPGELEGAVARNHQFVQEWIAKRNADASDTRKDTRDPGIGHR